MSASAKKKPERKILSEQAPGGPGAGGKDQDIDVNATTDKKGRKILSEAAPGGPGAGGIEVEQSATVKTNKIDGSGVGQSATST